MKRPLLTAVILLCCSAPSWAAAQSRCTDLDACRALVTQGQYQAAEAGLSRLRGNEASLLLGRVELLTGRYEAAAARAGRLTRGTTRVAAATLLGEAEAARGNYDEAGRAFESVLGEGDAHRARVLLGRLLAMRGRTQAAQVPLMALIQSYNDSTISDRDAEGLAYVAVASDLLNSPHDANDAFQQSNRADPARVETQLEWAQLFLRHEDTGHAAQSLQQALGHNAHHPLAQALMARIVLRDSLDFTEAQAHLDGALAVNPNLVEAHVTRAGIAMRDMDLPAANQHLERALDINPRDLEALSVRAGLRFLENDTRGYQQAVRAVLAVNPRYAQLYTVISEYANWEHRYPQIVEMAREGLRLDPTHAASYATLGINLLRMGEEEQGLEALHEAWRRDRFNVRVFNLLELYDNVLSEQYERLESDPFVFRLHREERAIMGRYLPALLGTAWEDMRQRYGFTPEHPVHIEVFSNVEHFSVRTSGLPRIGVQGVCFGRVITALSPRAGAFNWGQILWHELSHVFHIQLSDNRVPRWFTEGLAEYETIRARPEWQREEDHRLFLGLRNGSIPRVGQLNHAFTHARSGEEVTLAYYASTMLVKYIVERYGFEVAPRMLRAWAQGNTTEEVVQSVLGLDVDALDRDFRAHSAERMAARADDFAVDWTRYRDLEAAQASAESNPSDADALAVLAASERVAGHAEAAREAMHRALRARREQPLARFVAARLALERGDHRTARADLRLLIESGHDGYEVRLMQARVAMRLRVPRLARTALERASQIDPVRPEAWQGLLALAEGTEDEALATEAVRRLVDIDQHDRQTHLAWLERLHADESWEALRTYGERTVYVDPMNPEVHRHYAAGLLETGHPQEAQVEAEVALAAEVQAPGPVHLIRARALAAQGQRREAAAAARQAVEADPALRPAAQPLM
ncbi:MAG: tetratricopeptide repeat protein [Sandaracinaceae bacterium]